MAVPFSTAYPFQSRLPTRRYSGRGPVAAVVSAGRRQPYSHLRASQFSLRLWRCCITCMFARRKEKPTEARSRSSRSTEDSPERGAEDLGLSVKPNIIKHKMKVENAAEDAGTVVTAAGGVTFEWLRQAEDASLQKSPAHPSTTGEGDTSFSVIEEFNYWHNEPDLAEAVAAIKALTAVMKRSQASTMMGLEIELKNASEALKAWDETSIPLSAGCDLFLRYVTRTTALEYEDISAGKARLIERGERFGEISQKARRTIALLGQDFILNGSTILTHGFSRVVLNLLKIAAANGKHFNVICTEGRPDNTGAKVAKELLASGIPVTLILDSGVGFVMEKVDMLLVGAEGVVESGGIINYIGTFQAALVARSMNKPVYVAAESYKFARLYPLEQRDLAPSPCHVDFVVPVPEDAEVENAARDYTPPNYLTLLFTDLGVLTPSAVSDELIQLYL